MTTRAIRVFLASPGDLEAERQVFYDVLPQLGSTLGVDFIPTGYEQVPATVGWRPQDLINGAVDGCDVFVAAFHRRWGQGAPDSVVSASYTEEEFNRALRRFGETGSPTIFCFFKHVELHALADPGPQLSKVLEFKRRLETSGLVLYRTFGSETDFARELETHLRAYVGASLADPQTSRKKILLPVLADTDPDLHRDHDLALAEQARQAAGAGQVEEAERLFAQLSQSTVTIAALDMAKTFFESIDNFEAAQAILDRKLALLRDRRLAAQEYMAVLLSHGWLDNIVTQTLSTIPPKARAFTERMLRSMLGPRFRAEMIDTLAQNFTLGELRALAKFYGGEGATVANKMGEFMGKVVPPLIERLQSEALRELRGETSET